MKVLIIIFLVVAVLMSLAAMGIVVAEFVMDFKKHKREANAAMPQEEKKED